MTCDEAKPLLNAHMDNETGPIQRAALDSHIGTCFDCAAELRQLERVRDSIRSSMPYYKAPPDLRRQVQIALRGAEYLDRDQRQSGWRGDQRQTGWRVWGALAAGVAFCVLGSVPFLLNARNQSQLVAEEFLSAHERALIGQSVDVVSTDQHTVKPWFNGKLSFSPPVTDFAAVGFPLEGGRLDYEGDHQVAALVYRRRLHKIDVFVRPSAGEKAPPASFERNGYREISWSKGNFLFTVVSDLNGMELAGFAKLLQNQ
jgi:anti-sigma factor RsiW